MSPSPLSLQCVYTQVSRLLFVFVTFSISFSLFTQSVICSYISPACSGAWPSPPVPAVREQFDILQSRQRTANFTPAYVRKSFFPCYAVPCLLHLNPTCVKSAATRLFYSSGSCRHSTSNTSYTKLLNITLGSSHPPWLSLRKQWKKHLP